MKDNIYSLQLLHHTECFDTREDAIGYIKDEFRPNALTAEPAMVFYGDKSNPNAILAIGSVNKKVFIIDTANIEESVKALIEDSNSSSEDIANLKTHLKEIVEACGLDYDDNKRTNQISYNPDPKDTLIADAETLSKAIDTLSKYVQKGFKENKLSATDTKTIRFSYADNTDGGKTLKAAVNISKDGEDDDTLFNNNIIGVKSDGIFASVDLGYDETKHELTFSTSGIRNNRFVDDANKKVISLGEHKQYDAVNAGHTVKITTNKDENTISADVKISEDETNILDVQDGMLFVDGKAINIKYKGTTVYDGIDSLDNSVAKIQETIKKVNDADFIQGEETETMSLNVTKTASGYHKVSGNVRLGENRSIKVENGGLVADVDLTFDAASNKLKFIIGDTTKEFILNGIDLVTDIYYDSATKKIIVVTKFGTLEVSVSDLFKTWEVDTMSKSPIELIKTVSPDTKVADKLSANIRLASTDNLLEIVDDKLIAKESKIKSAVDIETQRAVTAEKELKASVEANKVGIDTKIDEVKGNVDANAKAIRAEQTRAEATEAELKNSITTVSDSVSRIDSSLDKTINDVDGLAVKVQEAESNIKINKENIANNTTAIRQNATTLSDLKDNLIQAKKDIELHNETVDLALKEVKAKNDAQDEALTSNSDAIATEKDRAIAKETEIISNVDNVKSELAIEKTERLATETSLAKTDDDLQEQIGIIKTKGNEIENNLKLKIENFEVVKDTISDLQYIFYADKKKVGEINIPQDQFLKNVEYNAASKELEFTFVTSEGEKLTKVGIADLVDTYKAGKGLDVNENVFSIKLSAASEEYLTFDENGELKLYGIDSVNELVNELSSKLTQSDENIEGISIQVNSNTEAINELTDTVRGVELIAKDSPTIDLESIKTIDGTQLTANLKINSDENNIIETRESGLYANVNLRYNMANNTLTLTSGNKELSSILLSGADSLVTDGWYDSGNKKVVLKISKDNGNSTSYIEIPISDVIYDFVVVSDTSNPIQLEINDDSEKGSKILKASLKLSKDYENNVIDIDNDGNLFVPSNADKYYAVYGGVKNTVQHILTNIGIVISNINDKVSGYDTKIANMEQAIQTLNIKVDELQEKNGALKERLETLERTMNTLLDAGTYTTD